MEYVVHTVMAASSRVAARVIFVNETLLDKLAHQLIDEIRAANCLFEWHSPGYLAIDIADRRAFQHINKVLSGYGSEGNVKYEFSKQGVFEH